MALTNELLNANAATAALTEEQKTAIVEMSRNDEQTVIGQKTGEIYGGLDADILNASGIPKNGTEKTYDYAKRVIGEIKSQAGNAVELQSKLTDSEKEVARLNGIIAKGGADAETKRALEQARADLASVTNQFSELKTRHEESEKNYAKQLLDVRMDGDFSAAASGIKFKADLPQAVTEVLLKQAIAKVKGMNPEYVDDGMEAGTKVLAFKDSTGAIMRNPETNLLPFTAADLLRKELQAMGVLETGRKQEGAGSEDGKTNTGGGGAMDISGARTQVEASEMIARALLAQGKPAGSKEYDDAFQEIWKNNLAAIKALPTK